MKIYVLVADEYESSAVIGAYSDKDKLREARDTAAANPKGYYPSCGYGFYEIELDAQAIEPEGSDCL